MAGWKVGLALDGQAHGRKAKVHKPSLAERPLVESVGQDIVDDAAGFLAIFEERVLDGGASHARVLARFLKSVPLPVCALFDLARAVGMACGGGHHSDGTGTQ